MGDVNAENEQEYRVVTCADSRFFHFLPILERNVFRKTGRYPVIYNLGMTAKEVSALNSQVIDIKAEMEFGESTTSGNIKATHKPTCLLDFLTRFDDHCLYIDADVLMIEKVEMSEFDHSDIAVTPRHPNELRSATPFANGALNSGVIFFRNSPSVAAFLEQWVDFCARGDCSDQMALSDLLDQADLQAGPGRSMQGDLQVLKLDAQIYNDVGCTTGKLWHFKNAGRRFHKLRRWYLYSKLEKLAPNWLAKRVANRRKQLNGQGAVD